MKICIVSARFYPQLVGSGTSAYVIASELSKRGHTVVVLTDASLRGESSHVKLPFTIAYVNSLEDFAMGRSGLREALLDLRNHVKECNPEVIQVCNFMPMLLVSMIRSEFSCPVIFTFFNTPVIGKRVTGYFSDPTLDINLGRFIIQQQAYDQIILGSKHYVDAALSLGANPEKIKLSYLAPDVSTFNKRTSSSHSKVVAKYFPGTVALPPYILLPSRITAQKGILEAVDALAIINDQSDIKYSLLLTGMADPFDKKYAIEVRSRIKELHLSKYILIPQKVINRKNLEVFFKEARLVIIPSWYEGLGLAAIEAQYLGIPLAVSDTTGLNEVVDHGVNGVLFPPRSSQAIADAALNILNNKIDVAVLLRNARKTVVKFSLDRHINELEEIYCNVVAEYKND